MGVAMIPVLLRMGIPYAMLIIAVLASGTSVISSRLLVRLDGVKPKEIYAGITAGDLVQGSEKFRGATTQALKA